MKKTVLLPLVLFFLNSYSQTNVSGGIFSNTTWTKANSPYIVTDTVVVFPGVTLTIQPGVVVKFDTLTILEIRQAKLIAAGTKVDSITFTSNSNFPSKNAYVGIYLNGGNLQPAFNFCNFKYASCALNTSNINFAYTLIVRNSSIISNANGFSCPYLYVSIDSCTFRSNNYYCVYGDGNYSNSYFVNNVNGIGPPGNATSIQNCVLDSNQLGINAASNCSIFNCSLKNNQIAINMFSGGSLVNNCIISRNQSGITAGGWHNITNSILDSNKVGIDCQMTNYTITNCIIRYNGIGIKNSSSSGGRIRKNTLENDSIGILLGSDLDSVTCNRFCNNSAYALKYTQSNNNYRVKSNYWCFPDSASSAAVIFDAYDNVSNGIVFFMPIDSLCYLSTGINEESNKPILSFYPNPASSYVTFESTNEWNHIMILNSLGEVIYENKAVSNKEVIDLGKQESGVYFCKIKFSTGEKVFKLIKAE